MEMSPFCDTLPKKERHKYIMHAVSEVLNAMEVGTKFSGSQLLKFVSEIDAKCSHTEGETLRRYMRYLRNGKDFKIICIDRANSIYQKVAKTIS